MPKLMNGKLPVSGAQRQAARKARLAARLAVLEALRVAADAYLNGGSRSDLLNAIEDCKPILKPIKCKPEPRHVARKPASYDWLGEFCAKSADMSDAEITMLHEAVDEGMCQQNNVLAHRAISARVAAEPHDVGTARHIRAAWCLMKVKRRAAKEATR